MPLFITRLRPVHWPLRFCPMHPTTSGALGNKRLFCMLANAFGCLLTRLLCLHHFFRYDSVIATPPGECHEVILFDNTQIYPELVVYYTAN